MKIVHLINYFQPKLGYQETYLAKEQSLLGHVVQVFTSDRYTKFKNFDEVYGKILGKRIVGNGSFIEEGIHVNRYKPVLEINGKVIFGKNIYQDIFKYKPDVVIVHGVLTIAAIHFSFMNKNRLKTIYDDHVGGLNSPSILKKFYYFIFKKAFSNTIEKNAKVIIGVTKPSVNFLINTLGFNINKVKYVPLGIDNNTFKYDYNKSIEIRKCLEIPRDAIIGIYSGKIRKDKGIDVLTDVLKKLFIDFPKLYFIIIGNGDHDLILKIQTSLNAKKCFYFDFMRHNELSSYFSASDFAIWPKQGSISQLEAMACGNALIIPKSRGERVSNNNGLILENSKPSEIHDKISYLISNPELLSQFKKNSIDLSYKYSWKTINNEILNYAS